jgi:hypothetical protein
LKIFYLICGLELERREHKQTGEEKTGGRKERGGWFMSRRF